MCDVYIRSRHGIWEHVWCVWVRGGWALPSSVYQEYFHKTQKRNIQNVDVFYRHYKNQLLNHFVENTYDMHTTYPYTHMILGIVLFH